MILVVDPALDSTVKEEKQGIDKSYMISTRFNWGDSFENFKMSTRGASWVYTLGPYLQGVSKITIVKK